MGIWQKGGIMTERFLKDLSKEELVNLKNELMKAETGRPPKKWFDACLSRAGKWADDPAKACGALWHDPEKWDETKGEATKEAYGKSVEGVSKMVEDKKKVEDFGGESQIVNPDKPKTEDLKPSEKNISS